MLHYFFLVIPAHLNFMCRRFGTVCSIFMGGVSRKNTTILHLFPLSPVIRVVYRSQNRQLLVNGMYRINSTPFSLFTVQWHLKFRVPGRPGGMSAQISLHHFHLYRVRNWNDGKGAIICYRGAPAFVAPPALPHPHLVYAGGLDPTVHYSSRVLHMTASACYACHVHSSSN